MFWQYWRFSFSSCTILYFSSLGLFECISFILFSLVFPSPCKSNAQSKRVSTELHCREGTKASYCLFSNQTQRKMLLSFGKVLWLLPLRQTFDLIKSWMNILTHKATKINNIFWCRTLISWVYWKASIYRKWPFKRKSHRLCLDLKQHYYCCLHRLWHALSSLLAKKQ